MSESITRKPFLAIVPPSSLASGSLRAIALARLDSARLRLPFRPIAFALPDFARPRLAARAIALASDDPTGARLRGVPALDQHLAAHDDGVDADGVADVAARTAREVADEDLLARRDRRGVEDDEVRRAPGLEAPEILEPEELRGLPGEPVHRLLEREVSALAHEGREEQRRVRGAAELRDVGASVGGADDDARVLQDLRRHVGVRVHRAADLELGRELIAERDLDQRVDQGPAVLARDVGQPPPAQRAVLGALRRADPGPLEEVAEDREPLLHEPRPERRVGEVLRAFPGRAAHHVAPARDQEEDEEGLVEAQVLVEGPRRALAEDLPAALPLALDPPEAPLPEVGLRRVVEDRLEHAEDPALARDRPELLHRRAELLRVARRRDRLQHRPPGLHRRARARELLAQVRVAGRHR